jgi:hypothetical protein
MEEEQMQQGASYGGIILRDWDYIKQCAVDFRSSMRSAKETGEEQDYDMAKARDYIANLTTLWTELEVKVLSTKGKDFGPDFQKKYEGFRTYCADNSKFFGEDDAIDVNMLYNLHVVVREAIEKFNITEF